MYPVSRETLLVSSVLDLFATIPADITLTGFTSGFLNKLLLSNQLVCLRSFGL